MVDFEKAFDTVEHQALWKALREQSISETYIALLKKLYKDQTATVQTDVKSKGFCASAPGTMQKVWNLVLAMIFFNRLKFKGPPGPSNTFPAVP